MSIWVRISNVLFTLLFENPVEEDVLGYQKALEGRV